MNIARVRAFVDSRANVPVQVEDRPTAGTVNRTTLAVTHDPPVVDWTGLVFIHSAFRPSSTDEGGIAGSDQAAIIRFPVEAGEILPGRFIVVLDEYLGVTADADQVGDTYRVLGPDPGSTRASNKVRAERWDH